MAKATMEQMREEAIKRMTWWKLHPNVKRDFNKGILNMSEGYGALYWLEDNEKKMVDDWQKETGNLPYHLIRTATEFGTLMTILFVSPDKSTWKEDKEDSLSFIQFSYTINESEPMFSEYGSVGLMPSIGGLVRRF